MCLTKMFVYKRENSKAQILPPLKRWSALVQYSLKRYVQQTNHTDHPRLSLLAPVIIAGLCYSLRISIACALLVPLSLLLITLLYFP
jgi:hypothetical protein